MRDGRAFVLKPFSSAGTEGAGRELEVSVSTIRRWLAGRSDPRYVELWAIYEAWGEHPFPK
jgi:hypothetical protein